MMTPVFMAGPIYFAYQNISPGLECHKIEFNTDKELSDLETMENSKLLISPRVRVLLLILILVLFGLAAYIFPFAHFLGGFKDSFIIV